MKTLIFLAIYVISLNAFAEQTNSCPDYLKVTKQKLHSSKSVDLCELTQGKPVLIVNTASNCGFTPHFEKIEALHKKYQSKGLVVIGFPSDDFFQEEDDEKETAKICYVNYGVTFTMLSTSAVRGSDANSVFKFLGDKSTSPKWNFYKYLVDGKGNNVQSFSPKTEPDDKEFIQAIETMLISDNAD
ncbi:MAG: glutathione peroxidase [Thalassotalea sp.]|nr:glutathione peroxidase [Thalassotalea sp.]